MTKYYMLFKNSTLPSERTLVMSKATRTQIIEFAIKKAQQDGGELPKTINDKQLVKFLKTIDYDLIEIENGTQEMLFIEVFKTIWDFSFWTENPAVADKHYFNHTFPPYHYLSAISSLK